MLYKLSYGLSFYLWQVISYSQPGIKYLGVCPWTWGVTWILLQKERAEKEEMGEKLIATP